MRSAAGCAWLGPPDAGCRVVRLKIACAPVEGRTCTCADPTVLPSVTFAEIAPFEPEVETMLLRTTDCGTTGCHVTATPERGVPAASSTLAERGVGKATPWSPA